MEQIKASEPQTYTQVSVMDLRGKLDEIDKSYVRNAVHQAITDEFRANLSLASIAEIISQSLSYPSNHDLKTKVQLALSSSTHKIPHTTFDLNALYSSRTT